jgi:outer membrane protein TolC
MVQKGALDQAKLLEERGNFESARAALARAEMELKLLTGETRPPNSRLTPAARLVLPH